LAREGTFSAKVVKEKLEWAGSTLLAMQLRSPFPVQFRAYWPDFAPDVNIAYGYLGLRTRPAIPGSQEISEMDRILAWINFIPPDKHVLRRIVGMRALVWPSNLRYKHGWNEIAKAVGASRRSVIYWHQQGLEIIAKALLRVWTTATHFSTLSRVAIA
jgi:hypothetical protein